MTITAAFRLAIVLALPVAAIGPVRAQQTPPAAATPAATRPTGNAESGKRLYERNGCWQCHGYAGQGGRGVPDTPPLVTTRLAEAAFVRYVRQPAGAMPAYTTKVMTDRELADVFAYVRTLPAPKAPADIPLLKDLLGGR